MICRWSRKRELFRERSTRQERLALRSQFDNQEAKTLVVNTSVLLAAAGETGNTSPRCSDAIMTLSANRATESVTPSHDTTAERELMRTGLIRNSQIAAGLSPFGTMGRQTATTNATVTVVGKEMSQLMEQGFLHLPIGYPLPLESWIEPNLQV